MDVKILGMGCPDCKRLQDNVLDAAEEVGATLCITRVTDEQAAKEYSIERAPGLIVGGELKSSGRVPSKEEIAGWLRQPQG